MRKTNNRSVLVIGGGIAGIQASIDLANMGLKVYLVEKSPSIGGRMAQLDKTFPTNDCSICILAPKMMECSNHPNVQLLTYSELEGVDGRWGNFLTRVRKKARYVDPNKCTACGDCAKECPVEVCDEFNVGMATRKAAYMAFPQAVPSKYVIEKRGLSPCTHECPLDVNAHGYVALTAKGKFKEALALVRERLPFPGILGRVCTHPCEKGCNRSQVDQAISIRALKRFIADYGRDVAFDMRPQAERDQKVAVVGSGPAGLMAAYELRRMGYRVTVFEALPVMGGMLRVGVPAYRLPRDVLDREIAIVEEMGADIRLNTPVGEKPSLDDLRNEGYRAIFVAIGCHVSKKLGIPGEELGGVLGGVEFLRELNVGGDVKVGEKVAVIGGGDAAIDAARCAERLGAREVSIVYRRSRAEMPAEESEIVRAEEEGVNIQYLSAPKRIIGEGNRVKAMACIRMELGEPDGSGRRRPVPIQGSEYTLDVDMVIAAIGQVPDFSALADAGLEVKEDGTLSADPTTLVTSREGVFAGGDGVTGPATVIDALAAGRRAALAIDRYLKGEPCEEPEERLPIVKAEDLDLTRVQVRPRRLLPALPVEDRVDNFAEVELGLSEEMAVEEAAHCLDCGICSMCGLCEKVCEAEAVDFGQKDEVIELNIGAIVLATGFNLYEVSSLGEYGYGSIPNVITGLQFERMLSASGPTGGLVQRPSDGESPRRLAFIQCVGSRDQRNRPYCSAVCCMHATKEAILANEHCSDLESFIFYTDLRAVGKRFQEYIARATEECRVTYVRARPGAVSENPAAKNPIIQYEDTATRELKRMEVDMVILCQALVPSDGNGEVARKLGIGLDEYGFVKILDRLSYPVDTEVPGIFACGFCQNPQDIPDSVIQASGAAARVAECILGEGY